MSNKRGRPSHDEFPENEAADAMSLLTRAALAAEEIPVEVGVQPATRGGAGSRNRMSRYKRGGSLAEDADAEMDQGDDQDEDAEHGMGAGAEMMAEDSGDDGDFVYLEGEDDEEYEIDDDEMDDDGEEIGTTYGPYSHVSLWRRADLALFGVILGGGWVECWRPDGMRRLCEGRSC
jgi:hypothetical protein